jgi:hypothetical protein
MKESPKDPSRLQESGKRGKLLLSKYGLPILHLGNENYYFAINGVQIHAVSGDGSVQPSRHCTLQDDCKQFVSPTRSHVITLQKISTQEPLTEVPSVYVKSKDNDTVSNTCST